MEMESLFDGQNGFCTHFDNHHTRNVNLMEMVTDMETETVRVNRPLRHRHRAP